MNVAIAIADALVAALNGQNFIAEFAAVRTYLPSWSIEDLDTLRVTVCPKTSLRESHTRAADSCHYDIDIAVQKHLAGSTGSAEEKADADALMNLVDQIESFVSQRTLLVVEIARAVPVKVVNVPIYDPGQLREHRVLTSLLTVTYAGKRSLR